MCRPASNALRVGEPDCSVDVLGELGSHLKDLVVVQLLNVIANLVALLQAILLFVLSILSSDELFVLAK